MTCLQHRSSSSKCWRVQTVLAGFLARVVLVAFLTVYADGCAFLALLATYAYHVLGTLCGGSPILDIFVFRGFSLVCCVSCCWSAAVNASKTYTRERCGTCPYKLSRSTFYPRHERFSESPQLRSGLFGLALFLCACVSACFACFLCRFLL